MGAPRAAIISIGDELLRGDTQDTNLSFLCAELTLRGVRVELGLVIPDKREVVAGWVRELAASYDHVIVGGGIGPTPDDVTRAAVAEALEVELEYNAVALAAYERARGTPLNPGQREMCRLPRGAELVWASHPCPPGFIVGNVVVLPGVPIVLRDMWSTIAERFSGPPVYEARFKAQSGESRWAGVMQRFVDAYPELSFGSYPKVGAGWWAELVVRGNDEELVKRVAAEFEAAIAELPPA